MTVSKRKLIEVALPLEAINREALREKQPFTRNHPRSLHIWWARRPLVACRAVLFAQLVDDPSARPEEFPTVAAQDLERQRLFSLLERLVVWENSNDEEVLAEARLEIQRSCAGVLPAILDPFAGGGSIPIEAQRLGLEAHAADLNPVAVLINRALIEIPSRWVGHPPIYPNVEGDRLGAWSGATGLAEDVKSYGYWLVREAEMRLSSHYPDATTVDGSQVRVSAWIWARTAKCPNPACGIQLPLVRSFWLSKKKGQLAWCEPTVSDGRVAFEVRTGNGKPSNEGTVGKSGAV